MSALDTWILGRAEASWEIQQRDSWKSWQCLETLQEGNQNDKMDTKDTKYETPPLYGKSYQHLGILKDGLSLSLLLLYRLTR